MKPLYPPTHHPYPPPPPYSYASTPYHAHDRPAQPYHLDSTGWNSNPPPLEHSIQSSNSPMQYAASSSTGDAPHATTSITSKLTPSCSRCRSKKLRCRFIDPNSNACSICISKGIANECHRDVRLARSKKSKSSPAEKVTHKKQRLADTSREKRIEGSVIKVEQAGPNGDVQPELSYPRNKLRDVEKIEQSSVKPPSPASTLDEASTSMSGSNVKTSADRDVDQEAQMRKQKETEDAALLLEEFATQSRQRSRTISTTQYTAPVLPPDTAQAKWQKPATLPERLELLQRAKACSVASDEVVVRELVSVYLYRVNHLAGHVIYGPGYQRAVEAFLSMSVEEIVLSKIFIDPCCLATLMLVLCLGFEFHPWQPPPGRMKTSGFMAVQTIRQQSRDPTELWYSIARRCLAIEESYSLSSIPALQAACLFLVYGKESKGWMRMLHQVSVVSAQDFGLHRLGAGRQHFPSEIEDFIRLETGVRIWNFLVMRDWTMATDQSHIFLIHSDQMTTRKPLNVEDEALEEGTQYGQPRSEWTMMSYVIVQIELAELMRDSISLLNNSDPPQLYDEADMKPKLSKRQIMRERLDRFIDDLPHYFQLGSQVNTPGLVHVQRWLIYQQIFDLQLRLWRPELADSKARRSCLRLAENIIMHQANIRAICPVINKLQINFFHLFGACMIVLMDLIQQAGINCTSLDLRQRRIETRERIAEALAMFPKDAENKRGLQVLQVMLALEGEHFESMSQQQSDHAANPEEIKGSEVDLTLIAGRITREVRLGDGKNEIGLNKDIWPALLPRRVAVISSSPDTASLPIQTLLPTAGAWQSGSFDGGNQSQYHYQWSPNSSLNNNKYSSTSSPSSQTPTFDWIMALGQDPLSSTLTSPLVQSLNTQFTPARRTSLPRIF